MEQTNDGQFQTWVDGAIQTPNINETKDEVVCSKPFCPGRATQTHDPGASSTSGRPRECPWPIHSRESRILKPIWDGPGKETTADSMMWPKGLTLIPMGMPTPISPVRGACRQCSHAGAAPGQPATGVHRRCPSDGRRLRCQGRPLTSACGLATAPGRARRAAGTPTSPRARRP